MSLSSYKVDAFDDMMPGMFGSSYDVYHGDEPNMYGSFDAMPNGGAHIHSHSGHCNVSSIAVPSTAGVPMMDLGAMDYYGVLGSGEATSDAVMTSEELDSLDSPISPRSVASLPTSPRNVVLHVHGPSVSPYGASAPGTISAFGGHSGVEDSASMAAFVSWDGLASESTHAAFPSTFRSASPGLFDTQFPSLVPSFTQQALAAARGPTSTSCLSSDDTDIDSAPSSPNSSSPKKRKVGNLTSSANNVSPYSAFPMPAVNGSKRTKYNDLAADPNMFNALNMNSYWMHLQQLMQQNGANGANPASTPSSAAAAAALQLQFQLQMQMQLQFRAAALAAAAARQESGNGGSLSPREDTMSTNYHAKAAAAAAALADRERRVRPKVVPEKGAIQCQGFNRKKNIQCRNAALMEFIGPRPQYCAEHIDLDPSCCYTKCRSEFHKIKGDGKGCREVVLKEFSFCHKHYTQSTDKMQGVEGFQVAAAQLGRVSVLLTRLESEAALAKKHDPDLFQRKHKLIPKFQQMYKVLEKRLSEMVAEGCGSNADISVIVNDAQLAAQREQDAMSTGSSQTATPSSSMPSSPSSMSASMYESNDAVVVAAM